MYKITDIRWDSFISKISFKVKILEAKLKKILTWRWNKLNWQNKIICVFFPHGLGSPWMKCWLKDRLQRRELPFGNGFVNGAEQLCAEMSSKFTNCSSAESWRLPGGWDPFELAYFVKTVHSPGLRKRGVSEVNSTPTNWMLVGFLSALNDFTSQILKGLRGRKWDFDQDRSFQYWFSSLLSDQYLIFQTSDKV